MPHCIIECPASLEELIDFERLVVLVHDAAEATGLFEAGDVKARLIPYPHAIAGGRDEPHVHVTIRLLAGRSESARELLAKSVSQVICNALPTVSFVSVEVVEIVRETYCNRFMLQGAAA